jgi:predicted RNase H-like HicB family nuclease
LLRKDDASDYGVDFPDFPGCVTVGLTVDEARRMAAEALQFHVEGMMEDREPVPEPSSLEAVMTHADNRDAVAFLVDLAAGPAALVQVNILLPESLLAAIDRTTTDRSRFLAEAARAELHGAA